MEYRKPDHDYEALGDMLMTADMLPMLTVYENPADYPGKVVLRRSDAKKGTITTYGSVVLFDTLLQARHWIRRTYGHLTPIGRHVTDDPVIVEVWL